MTDILSQDEIDKLLSGGLGGDADADEPEESASPNVGSSSFPSSFGNMPQMDQGLPSFDSIMGQKKGAYAKRSALVHEEGQTNVQPATFISFDQHDPPSENTELGTILNIKLEVRVELGKTYSTLREVLDMGTGSVIELDKQNGEPVDMVVNKKAFAKGEMIVIGENFGARITDILSVHEIIEALR